MMIVFIITIVILKMMMKMMRIESTLAGAMSGNESWTRAGLTRQCNALLIQIIQIIQTALTYTT